MPQQLAIRKSDPLPFYAQLAAILRSQIQDGVWPPGTLLPSEADLSERYELSRTAVRQALAGLVAEGLVVKEKGRGTFVRQPQIAMVVQELRGFYEEMSERGQPVRTQILAQRVVTASPEVAGELDVPMGSDAVLLDRVRLVGEEPVVRVRTHLPAGRFRELLDVDLTERSLYDVLQQDYGVQPRTGRRTIEATVADRELARHLRVPTGSAILRVSAVSYDTDGAAMEHFVASYRGDRVSFQAEVGLANGLVQRGSHLFSRAGT
ncbi:MAG: GntR family transcriptional regulator [Mycobacteriales bacterium]